MLRGSKHVEGSASIKRNNI